MARQTIAALIAVAALLVAGGAVVAADPGAQTDEPLTNETSNADDAYVTDDGDVILVYEDSGLDDGEGRLTANLSDGELSGLYRLTGLDTDVEGSFSALMNRSAITADGSLSVPKPDAVDSLEFTVDSTRSPTEATGDVSLETTMTLPEDQQMLTALFESFETSGEVRTGGTSMSTSGSADWTATIPGASEQSFDYQLRSTDDGHVLEVERDSQVSDFMSDRWNSEANATEQLKAQFEEFKEADGVTTDFTLDEYNFEESESGGQLQVAYTVEFDGLNEFMRQAIVDGFAESTAAQPASMSIDKATLRGQIEDLSIERAGMSFEMDQSGGSASWNLGVENYNGLARAYFTMLQAQDDSGLVEEQVQRYKKQLEAMQAADYAQTVSWDGTVQAQDGEQLTAEASLSQRSENWAAFVEERSARDLPPVGQMDSTLDVHTDGDRINAEGSYLLQQEGMYTRALEQINQQLQRVAEQDSSMSPASIDMAMGMVENVGFQKATMDATVNNTAVTVDGSASFEDLSTVAELAGVSMGDGTVEEVHMDMGESEAKAYVRVAGAVDEGSTDQSAIRQLEPVTEETSVNMPDEWESDAGLLPNEDTSSASENTGESATETATETETTEQMDTTEQTDGTAETTTASGPGFTATLAGVALLAVALVAIGRRD